MDDGLVGLLLIILVTTIVLRSIISERHWMISRKPAPPSLNNLQRQHAYVTRIVNQYIMVQYIMVEMERERTESVPEIAQEFFRHAWMAQNGREMHHMADYYMEELDRANRRYQDSGEEPDLVIPPWFVAYCEAWEKEHADDVAALHAK